MPETSIYYHPELTLPDLLYRAVSVHPDLFIGYCDKNGGIQIQNYTDLLARAEMIAGGLYNLGLRQGDKMIIATQGNRETVELLWGGFLLGVVPTILQPPVTFSGYNPSVVKLMNVYHQLGKPFIFMSPEMKDTGGLPEGTIKHTEDLDGSGGYPKPALSAEDLAFIQFSSGSTGDPKGIMLSHRNLITNMDSIRIGLDIHYPDHLGNWMPLFHDMGLIGYHITGIYCMVFQYQVETIDFIMNPGLWLNLMSRQKVTISGCPNFGLALVVRHLNRKKPDPEWDFSSLKALLNGAEPISVRIMHEFVNALSPYGFRPEAMMPVYGMAEATLAISFAPLLKPSVISAFDALLLDRENRTTPADPSDPSARVLSEVGLVLNDIGIRITDENDKPLEEGIAGHIQVKGPNVTSGYYNNPSATAAAFCGEWLRTGDIGFFFEGRLYISGRYKDIIFKNGRNYFANDLETMSCSIDEIKFGKVCFGGTTGKEAAQDKVIAFVAGISDEKAPEIFSKLRGLLRSNLGITVDEMVLIRSNEIPKTSSGKLQRFKLMQRYISGEFDDKKITDES
ncbi:MAG: AMP-binding protein [Bacteroidetes bacterium]|nr:AMP-binding protein [Bacteroidota bacterium]